PRFVIVGSPRAVESVLAPLGNVSKGVVDAERIGRERADWRVVRPTVLPSRDRQECYAARAREGPVGDVFVSFEALRLVAAPIRRLRSRATGVFPLILSGKAEADSADERVALRPRDVLDRVQIV